MREKKILSQLLTLALFSLIVLSCKKSPTEPEIIKDPRTYSWTIDTLKSPETIQTLLWRLWGRSPSDVYVVGHDAAHLGKMWHFDGEEWSIVSIPYVIQNLYGIYGFAHDNVWAAGGSILSNPPSLPNIGVSRIVHYDGNQWKEYILDGGLLKTIWGSSPNDIWAGGWNTLFHFNGTDWKKTEFYFPPQGIQILSIKGLSANDVYMVGGLDDVVQPIDSAYYYLYHFDGSKWSITDSSITTPAINRIKFGAILYVINGVLYSANYGLYRKEGNNWIRIDNYYGIYTAGGTSSTNIFAAGYQGNIFHYNGADWKSITVKEGFNEDIFDILSIGGEVFMVGNDASQSYIIHGK